MSQEQEELRALRAAVRELVAALPSSFQCNALSRVKEVLGEK